MPPFIAAAASFVVDIIAAVIIGVFLIVAMNGFSERDATWGLGAYALISLAASAMAAAAAVTLTKTYLARKFSNFGAVFLAFAMTGGTGVAVIVVASFVAVFIAEYARTHR
ncbi:MAG TPA: hypothetical protein VL501_06345 [Pyrinomonadaceae bacterium]|nr:hypothetical protein [Pyrinomonadaceae bacterium]